MAASPLIANQCVSTAVNVLVIGFWRLVIICNLVLEIRDFIDPQELKDPIENW